VTRSWLFHFLLLLTSSSSTQLLLQLLQLMYSQLWLPQAARGILLLPVGISSSPLCCRWWQLQHHRPRCQLCHQDHMMKGNVILQAGKNIVSSIEN
jgi:hypothetical protein